MQRARGARAHGAPELAPPSSTTSHTRTRTQPVHTPPTPSNRSRRRPPLHTPPHDAPSRLVPARQVKALAAARLEGEALPAVLESESRLAHETTRLLRELDEARAELAAAAVRLHGLQQAMHAVEEQKVRTPDCSP